MVRGLVSVGVRMREGEGVVSKEIVIFAIVVEVVVVVQVLVVPRF